MYSLSVLKPISLFCAILIGLLGAPALACRSYNPFADISVIQKQLPAELPPDAFVAQIQFYYPNGGWTELGGGARARVLRLVQGYYSGIDIIVRDHPGLREFRALCYDPIGLSGSGYLVGKPVGYENGVIVIQPAIAQRGNTYPQSLLTDLTNQKVNLVLPVLPRLPALPRSTAASPRSRRAR